MLCRLLLILCFLLSATASVEAEDFSYPLFDGKSLHGWTLENDAQAEVTGSGTLKFVSGDGWLRSHHQYQNFLRAQV